MVNIYYFVAKITLPEKPILTFPMTSVVIIAIDLICIKHATDLGKKKTDFLSSKMSPEHKAQLSLFVDYKSNMIMF